MTDVMSEAEQEARSQGWVPKEEFKGDPEGWVDAEKFVERGEKIAAIATKKAKEIEIELKELKKAREEDKKTFGEFKQYLDDVRVKEKEAWENWHKTEMANIKAAKKEAIKEGDNEKLAEIEEYKDTVEEKYKEAKEKQKEPDVKTETHDNSAFKDWIKENSWYKDDEDLRIYADGYGATLQGKYIGEEFLTKVSERVKEKFPDKFSNPNREKSNTVEGAGGHKQSKGKTFDDLPPHAKAACNKFCNTIPGFTKEQYLKDVDWNAIMKEANDA